MTRFAERTFVTEPYRLAPPPAPLRERPDAIAYSGFAYPAGRTSVEYAVQSIQRQLPKEETFEGYVSPDPQVQRNLETIRKGRLPAAKDYEIYPNVWVGPALHGFNVLGPLAGTTLVGSAENVAARIREFAAQGTDAFILSGFPLIEEAHRVADLLFPLLDLDHGFEVPVLNASRRRASVPVPIELPQRKAASA
jgi:alkanesulfonate monooxygenase